VCGLALPQVQLRSPRCACVAPTAPSARTRRPRRNDFNRALVLKRQHSRDVSPSARTARGRLVGAPARNRSHAGMARTMASVHSHRLAASGHAGSDLRRPEGARQRSASLMKQSGRYRPDCIPSHHHTHIVSARCRRRGATRTRGLGTAPKLFWLATGVNRRMKSWCRSSQLWCTC
jgi:hypothetical protein